MFRIKTDIRQYKCDSQDKVEKLIRNWVIRPNDLIFSSHDNTWNPIGDHPNFVKLFNILDEQIRNEPDTIVTRDIPKEGASSLGASDLALADPPVEIAEPDEVTRLEASPLSEDEESPPAPPEPPEGIEVSLRTSDEITMMTERTVDLLGEDATAEQSEPTATPKPDEPRDHKDLFDREALLTGEAASEDLPEISATNKRPLGRHDLPEELFATAEISTPIDRDSLEPPLDELGEIGEDEDEQTVVAKHPQEQHEKTSEELRIKDESTGQEDDASGDNSPPPPRRPIHLEGEEPAEEKAAQASATEASEDANEESRFTHEFTVDKRQSAAGAGGKDEPDNDDDSDLVVARTVPSDEDLIDELALPHSDDTPEEETPLSTVDEEPEAQDDAAEESEEKESEEAQDDAPIAENNDLEDDGLEKKPGLIEASDVHPSQNVDFVSEGYDLPLPFPIKPSDADLAKGLKESRVSKAVKDRTFPQPTPNKLKVIKVRRFDLAKEPPKDESLNFIAVVVGAFLAVILLIVIFVRS